TLLGYRIGGPKPVPTGLSPAVVPFSKGLRLGWIHSTTPAPQPRAVSRPVWAGPRSLAATEGVSVDFPSSRYLHVSVPWVARGFRDRWSLGSSPRLIAACHARNLMTPRHPPRALRSLTPPIGPPQRAWGPAHQDVDMPPRIHRAARATGCRRPGTPSQRLATRR